MEEEQLLAQCRAIGAGPVDPLMLQRLGRRVAKAIAAGQFSANKIRVAVLSSFLTDMLVDSLSPLLLARGLPAELVKGPYGALATDLLSDQSITLGCDLVLLLPTHRDLAFAPGPGASAADAEAAVRQEVGAWVNLWSRTSIPIVQLSFDPPPARLFSEADGYLPGGLLRHIRMVNLGMGEQAPTRVALVDAEALAWRVGPDWHDPRTYHLCKQPCAPSALPELAASLAAASAGLLGKARKVLVLDLDNTVWGGVVGDVGLQGIVLGNETSEGEAFVALQRYAKRLASRGVILAVCSKNDEQIAREPFRSHSGMVLTESDIACFVANFEDKATNLRRIAATLNVGLDALVFVDDNPIEREWVKRELPEVLVIDLPEDPALYCGAIELAKPFPAHLVTAEDLGRNSSYRSRAMIAESQSKATDMSAFLQDLEAVARIEPIGVASLDRIVQLVAKTNQFKLNPQVFTAEEISARAGKVVALRFSDRLQDYGITAVAVTDLAREDLVVLNWVMSCRVFSRRLEHAMLEVIREIARQNGAKRIRAPFKQSAKNAVTRDVLVGLGFVPDDDGEFVAPVTPAAQPLPHYIRIELGSIK